MTDFAITCSLSTFTFSVFCEISKNHLQYQFLELHGTHVITGTPHSRWKPCINTIACIRTSIIYRIFVNYTMKLFRFSLHFVRFPIWKTKTDCNNIHIYNIFVHFRRRGTKREDLPQCVCEYNNDRS